MNYRSASAFYWIGAMGTLADTGNNSRQCNVVGRRNILRFERGCGYIDHWATVFKTVGASAGSAEARFCLRATPSAATFSWGTRFGGCFRQ